MVRYPKFPPAELWIPEYGSPEDPTQLAYLWAYSPYHQVIEGVEYPAVLLTTADKDTRVHWAHTAKFAAALQAATASERPVLMRFETQAGHGAGKPTSAIVGEYTELYEFLLGTLDA
jgi:prolyl oligopeptidase